MTVSDTRRNEMNETQSSSSNPSATSAGLAIGEPIRAFPLARSPRTVLWSSLGIVLLVAGAAGIQGASFPGATLEVGSGGKAEGNTTGGGAMKVERGKWTAERERNSEKIWLQFQRSGQDGVWIPLPAGQPASIAAGREVRFELHRAAGTFSFTGTFDGSGPGAKG